MSHWLDLSEQIAAYVKPRLPYRAIAGARSNGLMQLRSLAEWKQGDAAGGEFYAMLAGIPKISTDDEMAVIMLGDLPFVLGKIQRTAPADLTWDVPMVFEKGSNSPFVSQASQDSSDVASTTDTANYSTVMTTSIVLPTGAWTVRAVGIGFLSHSASGGLVRFRMDIDGTAGTVLTAAMPQTPIRGTMAAQAISSNKAGTIPVTMSYRPNTTGTAYAGGGIIWVMAFRTA